MPTPEPPAARRPAWRLPALIGALVLAIIALFYITARSNRAETVGARCFLNLLAGRVTDAAQEFDEYRRLASSEVPDSVNDDLLRLKSRLDYPVCRDTADRALLDRSFFLCLAASRALVQAQDVEGAAVYSLRYVSRSVVSVPAPQPPPPAGVNPAQILCRGYADPVESAWTMADLLRTRAGIHAALILLPATKDQPDYALVGVLIRTRLFLFDPWRAVPICRASDGCVADLQSLLAGRETLAPGFGGPGTPVALDRLRSAWYFVPASLITVLPDGFLLNRILADNGRNDVVYRSFRDDLRNLAAAVFGEKTVVKDDFTRMTAPGRSETVALWDYPFKLDQLLVSNPEALKAAAQAHRAAALYLNERRVQLLAGPDDSRKEACQHYDDLLKASAADPEVVEDASFFRAMTTPAHPDRAARLTDFLAKYPSARWRPLATLALLELEVQHGTPDGAKKLAEQLAGTPYSLLADFYAQAAAAGKKSVAWRYPADAHRASATTTPVSSSK